MPDDELEEGTSEEDEEDNSYDMKRLRVGNLADDTNPRELMALFDRFRAQHIAMHFFCGKKPRLEAYITMDEDRAEEAAEWANGRVWRGRKLAVEVEDR